MTTNLDIAKLAAPEFPAASALEALAKSPAPGPAISRAVGELPQHSLALEEAALAAFDEEYPFGDAASVQRSAYRQDISTVLRFAAQNLAETSESPLPAQRGALLRAVVCGRGMASYRRLLREGTRRVSASIKEKMRGPGAEACAREVVRVAASATQETEPFPALAHIANTRPTRHPKPAEVEVFLKDRPELAPIAQCARMIAEMDGAIVQTALSTMGVGDGVSRGLMERDLGFCLRQATVALLTLDSDAPRDFGQRMVAQEEAAGGARRIRDYCGVLSDVVRGKLPLWPATLLSLFLDRIAETALGAPSIPPPLSLIRSRSRGDIGLESAVISALRNEAGAVVDALTTLRSRIPASFSRRGDDVEESLRRELHAVLHAVVEKLLAIDAEAVDAWLDRQRFATRTGPPRLQDIGMACELLAEELLKRSPETIPVVDLLADAACLLTGANLAPLTSGPADIVAASREAAALSGRIAETMAKAWPRAAESYPRNRERMSGDLTALMGTGLRALAGDGDRSAMRRIAKHLSGCYDRTGMPNPLLMAMPSAARTHVKHLPLLEVMEEASGLFESVPPTEACDPSMAPTGSIAQAVLSHLKAKESSITQATTESMLKEFLFMQRLDPEVREFYHRDATHMLRWVAKAVATSTYDELRRRVKRQSNLLPRLGIPRAAARRTLDFMEHYGRTGLEGREAELLSRAIRVAQDAVYVGSYGQEPIRAAIENFEGSFPDADERAQLATMDPGLEPLLAATDEIGAWIKGKSSKITEAVFQKYDYESAHNLAKAKCTRDIFLVTAYGVQAMLLGSPRYFDEKLLQWLRTIFLSFQFPAKGESVRMTYQLLREWATADLKPETDALIGPYLQAALETLPVQGTGAVRTGAVAAGLY